MPATKRTQKNPALAWTKFTYAELLDQLRRSSDDAYLADDGLKEAYAYLRLHEDDVLRRKKAPAKLTSPGIKRTLSGKKTAIKAALNAVVSFAKTLQTMKEPESFRNWAGGFSNAEGKLTLRYGQFDEFERVTNQRLAELLPEFSPEDNNNWPGALSAQQTLSLFTQLCLRIHSEAPEESRERVMEVATRMVVLPALAFSIFQAGSANEPQEHAHRCLRALSEGAGRLPSPTRFESESEKRDSKRLARARACVQNHAWQRLLEVLREKAAAGIGPDAPTRLAGECLRLLESHVEHPHGSELWKALSKLSSTTPGANDLLVFEALKQLGHEHPGEDMRTRLICARTRYRAIEAGYFDSEFRATLNLGADAIKAHVRKHIGGWRTSDKLAKAFLLSRRCLIPSAASVDDNLAHQVDLAGLVTELLESCSQGNADTEEQAGVGTDLLVQRYLSGFLTNPRFAKARDFEISKANEAILRYQALAKSTGNQSDIALVSLFEGRVAWTRMLADSGRIRDVQHIYRHYGLAAKSLFDDSLRDQMLDSETPVWLLPEIICLITLGDDISHPEVYGEQLRPRSENLDGSALNFARTIQKVGERHYGIYFNLPSEVRRIRVGLLRMAKVDKQAAKAG